MNDKPRKPHRPPARHYDPYGGREPDAPEDAADDRIEGKNAVMEALRAGRAIDKVLSSGATRTLPSDTSRLSPRVGRRRGRGRPAQARRHEPDGRAPGRHRARGRQSYVEIEDILAVAEKPA